MDKAFKNKIKRNVLAYVDDILVKIVTLIDHPQYLKETLKTLREHGMKLNPSKFNFGVLEGKFLNFYVGKPDIKPNPEKLKQS